MKPFTITTMLLVLCIVNQATGSDALSMMVRAAQRSPKGLSSGVLRRIQEASEKADLNKTITLLNSGCASKCGSPMVLSMILIGSQDIYRQLYDEIKNKDKRCQQKLLGILSEFISSVTVHKDCLKEEYKTHLACFLMNVPNRFSDIADLVYGPEALQSTEAQAPCLDCMVKGYEGGDEISKLSNWLDTLDQIDQCSDPEPGQKKRIYSGTGLDASYTVMRNPDDDTYSIPLNLKFSADDDYDGDTPRDQVPEYYMQKVQKCLDRANEKMLGPDGEKLKIVIQAPAEEDIDNCDDSDIKEIKIGSTEHRSNAGKYEADINCLGITHEVLHLLGLCDEYEEKLIGYFEDPKIGDRLSTRDMTWEEIEKFRLDERYGFKSEYGCRPVAANNIMSNDRDRWYNVFGSGINDSLLSPGQFNAILYGSCEKRNKLFNECSQLAYKTDFSTEDSCLAKKYECEEQNFSGQDKQQQIEAINRLLEDAKEAKTFWERARKRDAEYAEVYAEKEREEDKKIKTLRERLKVVESWP